MRNILLTAIAASMVAIGGASAQNAMSGAPFKSTPSTPAAKSGPPSAPIGHRQPTQAEVGKADADSTVSAEDKELDRKIKNICRGC
jgi:hypothetical protein